MRGLTAEKPLMLAFQLPEAKRKLILADLYYHFPKATDQEIRRRFIARVLPREDVIRAYGFDPHEEGP